MTAAGWTVVAVIVGAMGALLLLGPRWTAPGSDEGSDRKADGEHE